MRVITFPGQSCLRQSKPKIFIAYLVEEVESESKIACP